MIKLNDTHDLNRRVDMIKKEEHQQCSKLNKEYLVKEEAEQRMVEKTRAKKDLMLRVVAQWEATKTKRRIFLAWKVRQEGKRQNALQGEYCQAFYMQGAKMRAFKAFKLYAQVAGNRMYERRVKERINIDVQTKVLERQNEKEFLVAMIKELEEQLRIEMRKKTILKAQCD